MSALAACTAPPPPAAAPPDSGPAAQTVAVKVPGDKTTVLDSPSAVALSELLLTRAPVVVVADRPDVPDTGAPVLSAAEPEAVRRELSRLNPETVLTTGPAARQAVGDRAKVVELTPANAGDFRHSPPPPSGVTVLLDSSREHAAAAATAKAAGAAVVPVRGTDPRADPAASKALAAAGADVVVALGSGFGPPERLRARLAVAGELPGGGQLVLPGRRLVAMYGHPGTPSLGVLGEQGVDETIKRVKELARSYEPFSDVPVVPSLEIIATVAQGGPGVDGDYSNEVSAESLRPWVDRAAQEGVYVVLDLQPGRADVTEQAKRYESLLRRPHVGLAIDPEWKLGPDQVPLKQIGGIDAAEVNRASAWLAELAREHKLPQKLLVLHQFKLSMLRDEKDLDLGHDELSVLIHMDGQGTTGQKAETWRAVVGARPADLPLGWKNFYDEDKPMLTPEQTMRYQPAPMMISYQ
ncbi:hypothetical protein JOF53_002361 [Crossiella equi]|uniref:Lipoprotein n=1 Tax=Crossiella equi TaxID=130796 RepID=A0ABS5AA82_9PSEU|nr:hypothetical protein [Crossiella equi]MBP2473489.1 hypothetical protein [Crossiella equi]